MNALCNSSVEVRKLREYSSGRIFISGGKPNWLMKLIFGSSLGDRIKVSRINVLDSVSSNVQSGEILVF